MGIAAILKAIVMAITALPELVKLFRELQGAIKTQPHDVIRKTTKTVKAFKKARESGRPNKAAKHFNDLMRGK